MSVNPDLLTYTTAPPGYDFGWTRQIRPEVGTYCGQTVRLVLNENDHHLDLQRRCYSGGLYGAMTVDIWEAEKRRGHAEEIMPLNEALILL
jgi:hypothetical protein